ncbi:MAG: molybdenum cofactor guanylyltransferase [Methylococcaceae bacterium]|nr:molybdenum cofactor guanylyltransferase [Methylococcaceae bacterium]MDD1616067.1 molybdenum cofactor guanylyltransferase [Methylococcaceae bacterium]OYV18687.1 MAG: molybdopterin-guanine dinucleotide biosynthesis protein A [Methylococcaceae bacterium NSP1-2]
MNKPTKITGVILAGGLARRMNHQDKGLVCYRGCPLVSYAIAALAPLVNDTLINANRNHEQYQSFGLPVIADQTDSFDGPLAGILTAMIHSDAEVLLIVPCDAPLMTTQHLQKLLTVRADLNVDIAVAFDGERLHPLFLAIKTSLQESLQNYLASGQRKVQAWLAQHNPAQVDFSDTPEIFTNINTLTELSLLEAK